MLHNLGKRLHCAYGRVEKQLYAHRILSSGDLYLPDFLGIGAQKSGSTWLYENLRKHPALYLTEQKEVEYFDTHYDRNLRYYSRKFQPGAQMVKGEVSPSYCYLQRDRIRFIRAIVPDVKLVLLLRNPIDRAWSHAYMKLVSDTGRRLEDVCESEFIDRLTRKGFRKMGDYPAMLENWLSIFPREQLYIGLFDDIIRRPQDLLRAVFLHIGVSPDVDWDSMPYNQVIIPPAGPDYEDHDKGRGVSVVGHARTDTFMPAKYRAFLKELYERDIEILSERYGLLVTGWLD